MRNSYLRLYSSTMDVASLDLAHRDDDSHSTIYGSMSYNRISGELHVHWNYKCPLTLRQRLSEVMTFVKFLIKL